MSHAVSRLRAQRLAVAQPFNARGARSARCPGCRVIEPYCFCAWRPRVSAQAGVCLLMHDVEPMRPSNTGWLIADLLADTYAFCWQRTQVDPALLALLDDPQWQPYIVFPGEFVAPSRVTTQVTPEPGKRPLFVLLDATWPEARKIFRKSPYLERFPVLSLTPAQLSRYQLRRSRRDDHFCTSEVASLCLALAGEERACEALEAYLDVFTERYLAAKFQRELNVDDAVHQRLRPFLGP